MLEAGDLVAITGAGAYGAVMASAYNSRPSAAEVLVDGGRFAVIRPSRRHRAPVRRRAHPGLAGAADARVAGGRRHEHRRPDGDAQLQGSGYAWRGSVVTRRAALAGAVADLGRPGHLRRRLAVRPVAGPADGGASRPACWLRCGARLRPLAGPPGDACRPTRDAGLSRLERDSGMAHQPLRALDDRLPGDFARSGDRSACGLMHRQRLIDQPGPAAPAAAALGPAASRPLGVAGRPAAGPGRGGGPCPGRAGPAPRQRLHPGRPCRPGGAAAAWSICGSRRRPIPAARRW